MTMMMKQAVPVFILSGFLGSGKTTLLAQALEHVKQAGRRPAVVMNEIGEVNLDGQLLDQGVPTAEMLSGCICCSIRGDFGMKLRELVLTDQPDLIFIEATGVANPMEIIDEVTDASLLLPVDLKAVITVVDAPHLIELDRTSRGKTYRLMKEQIRCANLLVLNKTDRLPAAEAAEAAALVREWNAYASIQPAAFARIDMSLLDHLEAGGSRHAEPSSPVEADCGCSGAEHAHSCGHSHAHDSHEHAHGADMHHTHDHVMAYTHYFTKAIDSHAFEAFVAALPTEVYRAKGILYFSDTMSRFLFQYAYREMDFVKITPQGDVPDVAVFIGENFSRAAIRDALLALEAAGAPLEQA